MTDPKPADDLSRGILDEYGDLQAAMKRGVALKKQARRTVPRDTG
ncbi:hypothetical protein [Candidatus Palauibacter sp.]